MLKKFIVSGFKAFKTPVTIDFGATAAYEFSQECLDSEHNIVKDALIYGYNASGKSSLALALVDIVKNLSDNHVAQHKYINYLNAENENGYAKFEYVFEFNGNIVEYNYKKSDYLTIIAESFSINGKSIILYDKSTDQNALKLNLAGTENLVRDLNQIKISVLRYVKSNTVLPENTETETLNAFFEFVDRMLLFWSLEDRSFIGFTQISGVSLSDEIVKSGSFEKLQEFLRAAGINDEIIYKAVNEEYRLFFKFPNGKEIDFSSSCSTGTSSLLLLFFWLQNALNSKTGPSFIVIDEFDAFYHYELSRFIIEELKKLKCQVVLTTHNTSLMTNSLLRPDCYYLLWRDYICNLTGLTDKELRFAHNIEKLYRGHEFERK